MKIDRVRTWHVSLPMARPMQTAIHRAERTESVCVEIAAGGLVGRGAALTLAPEHARAVRAMAVDLGEQLEGAESRDVRKHWRRLWSRLNLTGQSGIGVLALSAVDTALWDLLAQEAGLPLYQLLGAAHDQLPVYAQGGWLSYDTGELVEEAQSYVERGFRYYKMRAGSPEWRDDVERIRRVREALGDRAQVMVDANQGWSTADALAAAHALDELDLYWVEEPVDVGNVTGAAQVAAAMRTPLAAGETVFGTTGFATLIAERAADILMPDLQHCAGVTGFLTVLAQAQVANLPVSSHLFSEVSVHLLAASNSSLIVEWMPGWWDELFEPTLAISDGVIRPPREPGLGVRFAPDALSRYSVD